MKSSGRIQIVDVHPHYPSLQLWVGWESKYDGGIVKLRCSSRAELEDEYETWRALMREPANERAGR